MRFLITFLYFLLLGIINLHASPDAVEKKYIRFFEKAGNHYTEFQSQGIPPKAQRLSNNDGNIVLLFDNSLPDSIQIALNAAKKLWEAKLPSKQPIYISVSFEPFESNLSMYADVPYIEDGELQGCPCALASQILNRPYGNIDSPDGIIVFNSNINWNCSFTTDASSEFNLPTMTLRGITRCLGFGSSIVEEEEGSNDSFNFVQGYPTFFDKILHCNGTSLFDMEGYSMAMANFVTSENVYATANNSYKIYAPRIYVPDMSLRYFDDTNSLMSYSFGEGHIDLSIDDRTIDVLNKMGWEIPSYELKIKCDDISDDGIGSSYSTHTFSLVKNKEIISNHNWKFLLKDKSGTYTTIETSTTENFTIGKISNPSNYYVNVNGDLEGRIECEYTINGEKYSASAFILSLELKPTIISIDNLSIINNGPYKFYLTFNINYVGADYVTVEIEEEYNTSLRNYRFEEPYFAHVKTGNITTLNYSWVTINAKNKYGTSYKTLEYAPTYKNGSTINTSLSSGITEEIQLYNTSGNIVFKGTSIDFSNKSFQSGIYIKKELLNNGLYNISKIHIK
ncbi:MAG: hypothetical protein NC241_04705 [Bacteroides sp.]|nr:hypothetical protein [Bacteroides sp.]MCM1456959.1 hypothetical protein [Lachnoclostridium sp.]